MYKIIFIQLGRSDSNDQMEKSAGVLHHLVAEFHMGLNPSADWTVSTGHLLVGEHRLSNLTI